MSWHIYLYLGIELVQLAIIFLLAFKYRRLQRRRDEDLRFTRRPPQSITEESLFQHTAAPLVEAAGGESKFDVVRRA
ncbi:MAG: hypothetical protein QOE33_3349 [Acidobacteriota bacterium]|nr:hypothetical protein [Acidobacteriota bacterium]